MNDFRPKMFRKRFGICPLNGSARSIKTTGWGNYWNVFVSRFLKIAEESFQGKKALRETI